MKTRPVIDGALILGIALFFQQINRVFVPEEEHELGLVSWMLSITYWMRIWSF